MYKRYLFCFTILALFTTAYCRAAITLPNYFGDHMVLQRDQPVSIWGWGTKGERIQLVFRHKRMQGKVGDDGKWQIMLPAVPAGGPYQIELHSTGQTIIIKDVLFGDVWLCSGQSNMNFRMIEENTFARELGDCELPQLRLLNVKRASAVMPQADIKPSVWKTCNAESLKEFPAVAYFFAKQIIRDIHVPVAIVHASWGGSPLETFLGKDGFGAFPAIQAKINSLGPDFIEKTRTANQEISRKWEQRFYEAAVLTADSNLNRQAAFFDTGWKSIIVPGYLEEQNPSAKKGITWYRRRINLPAGFTDSVEVYLGRINYAALAFVNGKLIGKQLNNWSDSRFRIPASLLHKGENEIVVYTFNETSQSGFQPIADPMLLSASRRDTIPLKGIWEYKQGMTSDSVGMLGPKVMVDLFEHQTPTLVYNGMIAPLSPMHLKGVIWYQGEDNSTAPRCWDYAALLRSLIINWRTVWHDPKLPFLIVQLPPWGPISANSQKPAPWAVVQEAQRKVVAETDNAGLAVSIDVGDPLNIHPTNKHTVGGRLAARAKKLVYHLNGVVAGGPVYRSFEKQKNELIISFDDCYDGLCTNDGHGEVRAFRIAGTDGVFYPASARISGNSVIISSPAVPEPAYIRYAFDANPGTVNLYNKNGFPAAPFRTDGFR